MGVVVEKAVSSSARTKTFISLEGEAAQRAVDSIQNVGYCILRRLPIAQGLIGYFQWLDSSKEDPLRRKAIYILVKLAARSGALPTSLFVKGVKLQSMHAVSMGGFADVYKGLLDGELVALKRLRITVSRKEREKMYQVC